MQEKIKLNILARQQAISFAPNVTAFMAVTMHFIDEEFKMLNLMITVPHIQGV